jgi:F0F1-type ATP synthase assembly protein I
MEDAARSIASAIGNLLSTTLGAIGAGIGWIVGSLNAAIPWGLLPTVVFFGLLSTAWILAKR